MGGIYSPGHAKGTFKRHYLAVTDLSVCPALSMESFLMWSRPRASFLLLYSRVSECIVRIYIYMCLRKGNGGKARKHLCILVLHCVCVVLPVCACVCVCMHTRTHVSSSYTAVPPLGTPLHVFFSSVNSWLLEQNNCHFPASGSKVIQHNEMYKKEGEMADRRHAKSNVERSE